jgi:hypothetical protein
MFLWTNPFNPNVEREVRSENEQAAGLVSARWLALDSILRSLIQDPEGPEIRAMMRHDLRIMHASGQVSDCTTHVYDAYQEAAGVMMTWRKSLSD